jgi:pentatricopeptide repeat domain-containing protein 1
VVAAAVLFVDRRSRGLAPYWPSALAQLTGYAAQATPELAAAVAGAQRLHDRLQVPAALLGFQPAAAAARGGDGGSAAAGSAPPTPGNGAPPAAPSAGGSAAGLSRVPSAAAVPLYAPASTAGALHPAALAAAVAQLLPGSPGVADAAVLPEPPPAL